MVNIFYLKFLIELFSIIAYENKYESYSLILKSNNTTNLSNKFSFAIIIRNAQNILLAIDGLV